MVESEEAMHEFAEHVAAVNVPKEHELVPDTVYPELHVGWQVDPLARELVQSPAPPFVGAADASHGFAAHVAAVNVPALQEDVPDTVYPRVARGLARRAVSEGRGAIVQGTVVDGAGRIARWI